MPRPRIAVLGLFAADLTSRVARLPHWHETLEGLGATLGPGGKGSNQAIAAARLGASVSFIGKVGADPFGDMAKGLYDREGIDRTHLATSDASPTGTALILIDAESGHNAIVVNGGATASLTAAGARCGGARDPRRRCVPADAGGAGGSGFARGRDGAARGRAHRSQSRARHGLRLVAAAGDRRRHTQRGGGGEPAGCPWSRAWRMPGAPCTRSSEWPSPWAPRPRS